MKHKVLVIDDEPVLRQVLQFYLEDNDYDVLTAENGRAGIETALKERPDIVLTDLKMPEADGLAVLAAVNEMDPEVPVIVISGANRMDDAVQALRLGAWDYLIKPIQDLEILEHTLKKVMEKSILLKENRRYKEHLEELVQERTEELEVRNRLLDISRRRIIGILSQAAEFKDFETGNHFLRVSEYTACLAKGLGWDKSRVTLIRLAAPVHDIGKIGIPDHILLKEGKLTQSEWAEMQQHCSYGFSILSENRFLKSFIHEESIDKTAFQEQIIATAANIALNHHEKWDGSGYPAGLKGNEISIEARITAIADVFDALSSDRPYKKAWSEEECLTYLTEQKGKHFDPDLVEVFIDNLDKIRDIRDEFSAD
ncbi:MAG: response regulator [Spirochaetales bacterium]|nr:response regulator [Spirochaetales bacterium]